MSTVSVGEVITINIVLISFGILFCNINMPYIGAPMIVVPSALLCTVAVWFLYLMINGDVVMKCTQEPDIENPYQIESGESCCILIKNQHNQSN